MSGRDGSVIQVVGLQVPLSALSELVLRLHNDGDKSLAVRLGRIIDSGAHEVRLTPHDEVELLLALNDHPVLGLDDLREHLLARSKGRATV